LSAAHLLGALWLALPTVCAAVLHMVVVRRDWWAALARPLDGGRTVHGRRLLGAHKTWRGAVVMPVAAAGFGAALGGLFGGWVARSGYAPLDYLHVVTAPGCDAVRRALGHLVVNFVLGAAYVAGELPNSLIKRQLGVPPGGRGRIRWLAGLFLVGDQVDSVVAALGLAVLVFSVDGRVAIAGIVFLPVVHLLVTVVLRRLRLKAAL
jgi:CDP-archaeol synthase